MSKKSHLGKRARGQEGDGPQLVPAPAPAPATSSGGDKLFRCGSCHKSYSRVDHLSRHVRLHTQERPFVCQVCEKSFSRADLLKRHLTLHDPAGSVNPASGRQSTTPRENRVSQACEQCARLHIKCDNEKPCRRCEARGLRCVYPTAAPSGAEETVAHDLLSLAAAQFRPAQPSGPSAVLPDDRTVSVGEPSVQMNVQENAMGETVLSQPSLSHPPPERPATPRLQSDHAAHLNYWDVPAPPEERINDFLRAVMGGPPLSQNIAPATGGILSGTRTPRNVFDFGNANDWSLNEMDLTFIGDYNQHVPFWPASDTVPSTGPCAPDEPEPHSVPPVGVDATRKWRFRPVTRDSMDANLSLPTAEIHRRPQYSRRVLTEPLSNTTRDNILTMVASAGSQARPIASFPSTDLLDSLLQFFLSATDAATYFCHTPTFNPNRRPILTAAMVAAGATLTPDAPLQKLGLVFQEVVRVTIPVMIEKDNTLSRDVEILQAAYINLKNGFWSGNSRKMELAESFMQPWATMVRRAGWFSRSKYEVIAPEPDDEGDVLQDKWRRWVSQEGWKRLVLSIIQHDAQVSLMLSVNPNISYAELHLPLPYHRILWHASSAQAWKVAFLSDNSYTRPLPSVVDVLKDFDCLVSWSHAFDIHVASQGLLCAAWGLVHEYRQLSGIVSSGANQWHHGPLLLSSRLAELKKLLECIRLGSPDDLADLLLLEALSMHLHLSLDDVHLFAGVEGYQAAQRVFPVLKAWVRTPAARQAIWHAGQILRLAKAEAVHTLRDFTVVLVYQATLALWSFGIVSRAEGAAGAGAGELTVLTGEETVEVSRFINLGRGSPAVTGLDAGEPVLLTDVGRVMQIVKSMLSVEGERDGRAAPKLLENILDLVEELRRAVSV